MSGYPEVKLSDFETLKAMLVRTGVPHEIDKPEDIACYSGQHYVPGTVHVIEAQNHPATFGYTQFTSAWCFDVNGVLLGVGHYE